jgi:quinol monooxygenase YgiN
MAYVRISYMHPKPGQEQAVGDILAKLSAFYRGEPGYVLGYQLRSDVGDLRRVGRVGVWESEDRAVHAAQNDRALALRSQLLRLIDEESHEELSFTGTRDEG